MIGLWREALNSCHLTHSSILDKPAPAEFHRPKDQFQVGRHYRQISCCKGGHEYNDAPWDEGACSFGVCAHHTAMMAASTTAATETSRIVLWANPIPLECGIISPADPSTPKLSLHVRVPSSCRGV